MSAPLASNITERRNSMTAAHNLLQAAGYTRTNGDPTRWGNGTKSFRVHEDGRMGLAHLVVTTNGSEQLKDTFLLLDTTLSDFSAAL